MHHGSLKHLEVILQFENQIGSIMWSRFLLSMPPKPALKKTAHEWAAFKSFIFALG